MKTLLLRLDDACPKRDIFKWDKMESLLDKYNVKPLVGIIPACKDSAMDLYPKDEDFWTKRIPLWQQKGWVLAMHGYEHVFCTDKGGMNPINFRSEFAGESIELQRTKIRMGVNKLEQYGLKPKVFFAPAHTFDKNTLKALLEESDIRIISDVPANKPFTKYGITFIPQQSGKVRKLPFSVQTFCYHPNFMQDKDFELLETFLKTHSFSSFPLKETKRKPSLYDWLLMKIYYYWYKYK